MSRPIVIVIGLYSLPDTRTRLAFKIATSIFLKFGTWVCRELVEQCSISHMKSHSFDHCFPLQGDYDSLLKRHYVTPQCVKEKEETDELVLTK